MKPLWITVGIVAILVVAFAILVPNDKNSPENKKGVDFSLGEDATLADTNTKDTLPNTALKTLDGENITLGELVGKSLVVNVWATWCPFCITELPDFALLQEEFSDEIEVIVVNRGESKEKSLSFTNELNITDKMTYLLDPRDELYMDMGGFAMPETLFVNERGEIIIHKRGFIPLDEMRSHVELILKK